MLNYIKSELYRVVRSKGIYILTGGCSALLLAMNLVLYFAGRGDTFFPYDSTEFAFSMVADSFPVILILTLCLASVIFSDEYKNRTLMNSIAYGYPRIGLFLGKVVVGMLVSFLALAVALGFFIGSAYLLLENSGAETLHMLLRGVLVNIPILIAGELAAYVMLFLMEKGAATWAWLGLIAFFPMICSLLGMKFEIFSKINSWLLYTVAGASFMNETGHYTMAYMTRDGAFRCLASGTIGIVIFLIIGMRGMSKKEFK